VELPGVIVAVIVFAIFAVGFCCGLWMVYRDLMRRERRRREPKRPTSNVQRSGLLRRHENTKLLAGFCPDCGWEHLRGGPCGGRSQNVLGERCRTEFAAGFISERLAPCPAERQKQVYGLEASA